MKYLQSLYAVLVYLAIGKSPVGAFSPRTRLALRLIYPELQLSERRLFPL